MMRKWSLVLGLLLVTGLVHAKQDEKNIKKFCAKRCFYYCKNQDKAVKDCQLSGVTTISFDLKCQCRDLEKNEKLPTFAPNYIINTHSGVHVN